MSLRRRLLLGLLAVVAVLVTTNVVLFSTFEQDLHDRVDQQLAEVAGRPTLASQLPPADGTGPGAGPLSELFIGIADLGAGRLIRLGSALGAEDPPAVTAGELARRATPAGAPLAPFTVEGTGGETTWRLGAVSGRVSGGALLVVGVDLGDVEATLDRMRSVQVLGSVAVLAALGAVAWWVLRLGVGPLVAMAATADEIAAGDLTRRVRPVDEHTEAGRLGLAFNHMLERLEGAFRQRAESEDRVRRFAADASHELRTPLTSMRGYAELWEAGGLRQPEQLDEAMRRLGDEARRMGTLVEDLLVLARLDQDRPRTVEPVRLDELAADAVADLRALQPQRPVTVELSPAVAAGDPDALRQVVGNLVGNARIHTPPSAAIRVTVTAPGRSAPVRLEVADDGPGMDAETAARIFERFFRADRSRARSESGGGSGLGLAIVESVVSAHGGAVRVDTTPGAGSRFVVELPAWTSEGTEPG